MVTSRTRRTRSKATDDLAAAGKIVIPMGEYDPEDDRAYAGEQPRPGVHTFRLYQVGAHTSSEGKGSIRWQFAIEDKKSPYHGWPYGDIYTNLDPDRALFKTQQTVYALTGAREDLDLDLSDTKAGEKSRAKFLDGCALVRGRVYLEEYNGEERAKLGRVMPMPENVEEDEEDDFDEEDVEDDDDYDDEEEEQDDDVEEEDDEEVEEDDQEEEEPAPRRRAGPAKKATRAVKKAPASARRRR